VLASGMRSDLGGGLILRRATREDADAVAAFNARIHFSPGGPFERREPHRGIAAGARDLMSGDHPTCDASDFTVVEDTATGAVVSSGRLKVSFYGGGLLLELKRGRLNRAEGWSPTDEDEGDASFPDLTFLQLLFGYRSLEELDHAFADCRPGGGDARVLLAALFPRRPSDLWPVC
jgi:hypothetical protein